MRRKLSPLAKKIIIISSIFVMVTIIGVVFSILNNNNFMILESLYFLTGAIFMIVALFNARARDNKNFKEKKTIVEDERDPEYKEYKRFQSMLWIIGATFMVASLIIFFIFVK
jgi:hypothetical protein